MEVEKEAAQKLTVSASLNRCVWLTQKQSKMSMIHFHTCYSCQAKENKTEETRDLENNVEKKNAEEKHFLGEKPIIKVSEIAENV